MAEMDEGKATSKSKAALAGYLVMVAAWAFAVYANSVPGDFVFDDRIEILNNPTIRSTANLGRVFREPFWSFAQSDPTQSISNYYRPLKSATYIVGVRLWGFNPFYFHLLTVGLHALAGVLVFLVAAEFIRDRRYALAAALLFVSHPAHTESVAWISSLSSTLFITFYILAFYLYLVRERLRPAGLGLALSGICFFASLLAKETAMSFPALILLTQFFFKSPARRITRALHIEFFIAVLAGYIGLRYLALSGFSPTLQLEHMSEVQVLLSVAHLFAKYLAFFIYPVGQSAHHVFVPVLGLGDWRLIASIPVLAGFASAAAILYRRKSIFSYYIAWIPFTMFPVLYIRAIAENVFCERYLYLPSIGFSLILAHGMMALAGGLASRRRRIIAISVLLYVIAVFSVISVSRNPVWRDNLPFFQATFKTAPEVRWINRDLCAAYFSADRTREALRCFETYLKKHPGDYTINFNQGGILATLAGRKLAEGKLEEAEDLFDRAEKLITTSFQNSKRDADVYFNLAGIYLERTKIYYERREMEKAEQAKIKAASLLQQAKARDPEHHQSYAMLGNILMTRATDLRQAAASLTGDDQDQQKESLLHEADVMNKAAIKEFEAAIKLFPQDPQGLMILATAYMEAARCEDAERTFLKALELSPGNYNINLKMGELYAGCLDRPGPAVDYFIRAMEINPDDPRAKFHLQKMGAATQAPK